jgi:hypothetical protein
VLVADQIRAHLLQIARNHVLWWEGETAEEEEAELPVVTDRQSTSRLDPNALKNRCLLAHVGTCSLEET